jgi:hypothetical protein
MQFEIRGGGAPRTKVTTFSRYSPSRQYIYIYIPQLANQANWPICLNLNNFEFNLHCYDPKQQALSIYIAMYINTTDQYYICMHARHLVTSYACMFHTGLHLMMQTKLASNTHQLLAAIYQDLSIYVHAYICICVGVALRSLDGRDPLFDLLYYLSLHTHTLRSLGSDV